MKRRDTIIVAALINAGLLLILFATAVHKDKDEGVSSTSQVVMAISEEGVPPTESMPMSPTDEVDQVLAQWAPAPTSATPLIPQVMDETTFVEQDLVKPPSKHPISGEIVDVTVKKGDVLERIAKANGTTVDEIMRLNKLSSSRLKIGQVLKVPIDSKGQTVVKAPKPPVKQQSKMTQGTRYYTMKKGDSLWSIASKNSTTVEDLLKLNQLDEDRARRLKPGDQIVIR